MPQTSTISFNFGVDQLQKLSDSFTCYRLE